MLRKLSVFGLETAAPEEVLSRVLGMDGHHGDAEEYGNRDAQRAVSYTHLTLPTNREV